MSDNTPLLTVAVLLEELKEVDDWRMLGAHLNVPVHVLNRIDIEHDGVVEHCKMYMLQYWLDTTTITPSWKDIARAIEHLNMLALAERLNWKYLRTSPATAADGEEQYTPHESTISEDTTPDLSVDDDTAHRVLEREVGVSTVDLMLAGSPGSGKTSVMHLTLNEPPPDVRHSTGCVETPVRAIASGTIYANGTMMKKLETEEMLDMVCRFLRHAIEQDIRRQYDEHMHIEIRSVSSTAAATPTHASLEDSPRQDVAAPPKADNTAKQQVFTPQAQAITEEERLKVFAKLMKEVSSVKASPDLFSPTLVLTTDSGGQPQFMDACSLLLRSNSLFMITVKLNERLDDKPMFDFFINGKPISMYSTSFQLTNLQLIESIAKTVSSIQLSTANAEEDGFQPRQAKFMLIGTFADKADECKGETIADKNRILKEKLKHFKAELVKNGDDVIFPVNAVTTNADERQTAALRLQEIITNTPGTSIKSKIKLRWFGLLMHMLEVAKKKDVSILQLDEIIAAGKCLMMSEEETRQAVKCFQDMNLVNHHSTQKLDHLVFVNVKPILDQLSNLIGIAFIDKNMLDEILQTKVPINAQEMLRDYGQFSQSLLESCFSFPAPLTVEVFINVLEHLSMVSRIEKDGQTSFFLPSALPYAPEDVVCKKEVSVTPWILRLKLRRDAVLVDIPIPMGYLPTLVISLITSRNFEADFDSHQYRNVMSIRFVDGGHVYFIERSHQLEIYYSWDEESPEKCSIIRSEIMKALVKAEEKLHFKPDILTKEDVFICSCDGPHPRHFCAYNRRIQKAVCEMSKKPCNLSKQQQCWFLPQSQGSHSSGSSATPPTVDQAAVIHAYDVNLRASKQNEHQLKSQLAKLQQESQDLGEQLSKLEDENFGLQKERLVLKHANELQQEELNTLQQTVTCDEARLAASEEEQQRLLQEVEQWKKMFHARGVQISQLQNENKQPQDIKLSASYQQQVKEDHNVKEQSTETELTAQKLVLSLHDKQDGKCSVATVDTGVQANYLAVAPDFLRGVEVYGETVLEVVGDKLQKLEWPGYGFYIEVPDGALAPGVTASVAVKVILGGQFTLPDENSQLISAIYWIVSSEVFLKKVAVNIQHYAVITSEEQCSKLRFIVAKCSQEVLPYTFREKEGLFNAHTQYGAIKVKRFSIFSLIGPKGIDSRITSLKFYKPRPSSTHTLVVDFDFVVLCNHEPFLKDVRERYHSKKYQEDTQNQMLVFEKKKIVLDLPAGSCEPKVVDGWKILPMTYPQIEKCDIERYRCGKNVPGCTIELMWMGDGKPKELYYQVNIIGAKEPANYFHLRYSPQAVVSTSTVPDTPSGATPTVQDVTASPAEHNKQDDPLKKRPRMNDLLNRVASQAMDKWEVVGLQLNIPPHQLHTIKKDNSILCYADVFDIWERKSDPPFTWATIVEALRSPIVNENKLAKEIEDWLK